MDYEERLKTLCVAAINLALGLSSMIPTARPDNYPGMVLSALAANRGNKLTSRHLQVVRTIVETETLEEAGSRLCIATNTMRNHVTAIIQRSGLTLRGAAELRGWCLGIVYASSKSEILVARD